MTPSLTPHQKKKKKPIFNSDTFPSHMCCFLLLQRGNIISQRTLSLHLQTSPPHIIYLTEPKWIKEDFQGKMKPFISPAWWGRVWEKRKKKDTLPILQVTCWETCSRQRRLALLTYSLSPQQISEETKFLQL